MQHKADLAVILGELEGIGEKIAPDEKKQLCVCTYQHALLYIGFNFDILSLPRAFILQKALA